jgi:two-component system phosphate regulon sensor histidine kinase PhoR
MKKNSPSQFFSWTYFFKIAQVHGILLFISIFFAFIVQRIYFKEVLIQIHSEYLEQEIQRISVSEKNENSCLENTKNPVFIFNADLSPLCKSSLLKIKFPNKDFFIQKDHIFVSRKINDQYIIIGKDQKSIFRSLIPVDETLWLVLLPTIILIYLILLWSSLRFSRPFRVLLERVNSLRNLTKSLDINLTSDGPMASFVNTLAMTETQFQDQINTISKENYKNKILLESITDGILTLNNEGEVLFYNTRFFKKFIRTKIKEKLFLKDLFPESQEIIQAFEESVLKSATSKVKDFRVSNQNRNLYYEITFNPIYDEKDDKNYGVVAVFNNITETKLTEQMRVDFVANVSHEIKTPLTAIKGFSQIILKNSENLNDITKDAIKRIHTNTDRIHHLFSDLLSLSVIESRYKLSKEWIKLDDAIQAIIPMIKQNYKEQDPVFEINLKENNIFVDPKLFERCLINLFDNSCKYSGQKTHVSVTSRKKEDCVLITFIDNGPGIVDEHLTRIFERFYRVPNSGKAYPKGTGLGLSIVKHIINKHKGRIWAKNLPEGKTTAFIIELPHY